MATPHTPMDTDSSSPINRTTTNPSEREISSLDLAPTNRVNSFIEEAAAVTKPSKGEISLDLVSKKNERKKMDRKETSATSTDKANDAKFTDYRGSNTAVRWRHSQTYTTGGRGNR